MEIIWIYYGDRWVRDKKDAPLILTHMYNPIMKNTKSNFIMILSQIYRSYFHFMIFSYPYPYPYPCEKISEEYA